MLEKQLLAEFDRRLRAETAERLADSDGSSSLDQASAQAEVMFGYLKEAAAVSEHEPCPYEDSSDGIAAVSWATRPGWRLPNCKPA